MKLYSCCPLKRTERGAMKKTLKSFPLQQRSASVCGFRIYLRSDAAKRRHYIFCLHFEGLEAGERSRAHSSKRRPKAARVLGNINQISSSTRVFEAARSVQEYQRHHGGSSARPVAAARCTTRGVGSRFPEPDGPEVNKPGSAALRSLAIVFAPSPSRSGTVVLLPRSRRAAATTDPPCVPRWGVI